MKKEAVSDNALSVIITRTGIVVHHDHISRDLQRYCQSKNISQITLVGQLVSVDFLGNELEEGEIRGIVARRNSNY